MNSQNKPGDDFFDSMTMKSFNTIMVFLSCCILFVAACGPAVNPEGSSDIDKVELVADRVVYFTDRDVPVTGEEERISFTVYADGAALTPSEAEIYYSKGDRVDVSTAKRLEEFRFSGKEAGEWSFVAVCEGVESETVSIDVIDAADYVSDFERHVAAVEFTGAWCSWCPQGLTVMNNVIELFPDCVHLMAFHSKSGGDDELAIAETESMYNFFRLGDYPQYLTDMRTGGGLEDGYGFMESIEESLSSYPAHCGVAVSSVYADGKADITVKLKSELELPYRIAVFLVEDGVKYRQTGVTNSETYVHFHVVRKVVSSSWNGDKAGVGSIPEGEEYIKEYQGVLLGEGWNPENTSVYVLALDYASRVNNMNICPIVGGSSDYKLENN